MLCLSRPFGDVRRAPGARRTRRVIAARVGLLEATHPVHPGKNSQRRGRDRRAERPGAVSTVATLRTTVHYRRHAPQAATSTTADRVDHLQACQDAPWRSKRGHGWQNMSNSTENSGGGSTSRSRDWSKLMARAQDGDRIAYRALLEAAVPYLRAMAARRFKDASDIDDSVQDILLTVHAMRHTYDPRRPFGPWLVTIANRRIIDRLRRRLRTHARETEFTAEHETFSADGTNLTSNRDEASADDAALHAAIEQLPPDQREAVRLLKLKQMSLKEAALASRRSVSALKVATHRAVKGLRKMLQPSTKQ
jgi:RNA polymerase sigma-70 factor, ECF subfamily